MATWAVSILLTISTTVSAKPERSHWGNAFVIPFLSNFEKRGDIYVRMMAREATDVFADIPWENRQEHVTIAQNSRSSLTLVWDNRYEENLVAVKKAIYINSTKPIAVYILSWVANSASSFLAFPVDVLGDHYVAVSFIRSVYNTSVIVAAVLNDTEVTFHYNTHGGTCGPPAYVTGDTSTHILNTQDVIGVHCTEDVTGTFITSNKPVSVVSGNIGVKIPSTKTGKDVAEEMIPPVKDFGTSYVLSNAGRNVGTINRVVAVDDDTEITSSTGDVYSLAMSEHVDIPVDGQICIESTKPVLVVAFGKGIKGNSDNKGDPLMAIVPPVDRFYFDYFLIFHMGSDITGYKGKEYISVVASLDAISDVESQLTSAHTPVANCNYGVIYDEVTTWPLNLLTSNTTRSGVTFYSVSSSYVGIGMNLGMAFISQLCWSSSCYNNGTCEETEDSFICHCSNQYTGSQCETSIEMSSVEAATISNILSTDEYSLPTTGTMSAIESVTSTFDPDTQIDIISELNIMESSNTVQIASLSITPRHGLSEIVISTETVVEFTDIPGIQSTDIIREISGTFSPFETTNIHLTTESVIVVIPGSTDPIIVDSSTIDIPGSHSNSEILQQKETSATSDSPVVNIASINPSQTFIDYSGTHTDSFVSLIPPQTSLEDYSGTFTDIIVSLNPTETANPSGSSLPTIGISDSCSSTSPCIDTSSQASSHITSCPMCTSYTTYCPETLLSSLSSMAMYLGYTVDPGVSCTCLQPGSRLESLDSSAVEQARDKIQEDLLLDTKTLSKTIRRYISAPDERKSAQNVGTVGIVMFVLVFGGMIVADIVSLFREIYLAILRRHRKL